MRFFRAAKGRGTTDCNAESISVFRFALGLLCFCASGCVVLCRGVFVCVGACSFALGCVVLPLKSAFCEAPWKGGAEGFL